MTRQEKSDIMKQKPGICRFCYEEFEDVSDMIDHEELCEEEYIQYKDYRASGIDKNLTKEIDEKKKANMEYDLEVASNLNDMFEKHIMTKIKQLPQPSEDCNLVEYIREIYNACNISIPEYDDREDLIIKQTLGLVDMHGDVTRCKNSLEKIIDRLDEVDSIRIITQKGLTIKYKMEPFLKAPELYNIALNIKYVNKVYQKIGCEGGMRIYLNKLEVFGNVLSTFHKIYMPKKGKIDSYVKTKVQVHDNIWLYLCYLKYQKNGKTEYSQSYHIRIMSEDKISRYPALITTRITANKDVASLNGSTNSNIVNNTDNRKRFNKRSLKSKNKKLVVAN